MDKQRRYRVVWYWWTDDGPRLQYSDHRSEARARQIGTQRVREVGGTHFEVIDRGASAHAEYVIPLYPHETSHER